MKVPLVTRIHLDPAATAKSCPRAPHVVPNFDAAVSSNTPISSEAKSRHSLPNLWAARISGGYR